MTADEKNGWSEHKLLVTSDIKRLEKGQDALEDSVRQLNLEMVKQVSCIKHEIKEHFDVSFKEVHDQIDEKVGVIRKRVSILEQEKSNNKAVRNFVLFALGLISTIAGLVIGYLTIKN